MYAGPKARVPSASIPAEGLPISSTEQPVKAQKPTKSARASPSLRAEMLGFPKKNTIIGSKTHSLMASKHENVTFSLV
jgi:hypothetical protein